MKRVQMRAEISGTRDGVPWPKIGGFMEVSDFEANDMAAARLAVIVDDLGDAPGEPATDDDLDVETADVEPSETATIPGRHANKPRNR